MKAKYILRGLGLGMIITAVVMGAYTRSAVADARVKVLKEYGIGEEAMLAETLVDVGGDNANNDDTKKSAQGNAPEIVPFDETLPTQTEVRDEDSEQQGSAVSDGAADTGIVIQGAVVDDENAQEPASVIVIEPSDDTEVKEPDDTITIVIAKGDSSLAAAIKLQSAGLVESAFEFDAFLMQHGYDKRINTGTKKISKNDTWEVMAEKLTK